MQGARVPSLVRELDPTSRNEEFKCRKEKVPCAAAKIPRTATKTWRSQINKYFFLKKKGKK